MFLSADHDAVVFIMKGLYQVTSPDHSSERFELSIPISAADIDEHGHVNNVVYVRWIQDVATAHWKTAATAAQQAEVSWFVVRHEIDYKHAARLGDDIMARTWVGTATARTFERFTEILRADDRRLLARARTLWCPIDVHTGKLTRVGTELRERFSVPVAEEKLEF